jgi:hypothetical protein
VSDSIGQPPLCTTRPSWCFPGDFPEFLEADAVGLRIDAVAQIELRFELLAEMAAAAFGKESVFAMQFHADLEIRPFRAVVQAAHIAGGNAFDRAIFIKQYFSTGKAGVDFNT